MGYGPSVSGASVCLSVSDPFLIGCEKSRDKILGSDSLDTNLILDN